MQRQRKISSIWGKNKFKNVDVAWLDSARFLENLICLIVLYLTISSGLTWEKAHEEITNLINDV